MPTLFPYTTLFRSRRTYDALNLRKHALDFRHQRFRLLLGALELLVGAARSVFTGRSVFRSGMDMFVVGLGVAAVGYYVGEWVGRLL